MPPKKKKDKLKEKAQGGPQRKPSLPPEGAAAETAAKSPKKVTFADGSPPGSTGSVGGVANPGYELHLANEEDEDAPLPTPPTEVAQPVNPYNIGSATAEFDKAVQEAARAEAAAAGAAPGVPPVRGRARATTPPPGGLVKGDAPATPANKLRGYEPMELRQGFLTPGSTKTQATIIYDNPAAAVAMAVAAPAAVAAGPTYASPTKKKPGTPGTRKTRPTAPPPIPPKTPGYSHVAGFDPNDPRRPNAYNELDRKAEGRQAAAAIPASAAAPVTQAGQEGYEYPPPAELQWGGGDNQRAALDPLYATVEGEELPAAPAAPDSVSPVVQHITPYAIAAVRVMDPLQEPTYPESPVSRRRNVGGNEITAAAPSAPPPRQRATRTDAVEISNGDEPDLEAANEYTGLLKQESDLPDLSLSQRAFSRVNLGLSYALYCLARMGIPSITFSFLMWVIFQIVYTWPEEEELILQNPTDPFEFFLLSALIISDGRALGNAGWFLFTEAYRLSNFFQLLPPPDQIFCDPFREITQHQSDFLKLMPPSGPVRTITYTSGGIDLCWNPHINTSRSIHLHDLGIPIAGSYEQTLLWASRISWLFLSVGLTAALINPRTVEINVQFAELLGNLLKLPFYLLGRIFHLCSSLVYSVSRVSIGDYRTDIMANRINQILAVLSTGFSDQLGNNAVLHRLAREDYARVVTRYLPGCGPAVSYQAQRMLLRGLRLQLLTGAQFTQDGHMLTAGLQALDERLNESALNARLREQDVFGNFLGGPTLNRIAKHRATLASIFLHTSEAIPTHQPDTPSFQEIINNESERIAAEILSTQHIPPRSPDARRVHTYKLALQHLSNDVYHRFWHQRSKHLIIKHFEHWKPRQIPNEPAGETRSRRILQEFKTHLIENFPGLFAILKSQGYEEAMRALGVPGNENWGWVPQRFRKEPAWKRYFREIAEEPMNDPQQGAAKNAYNKLHYLYTGPALEARAGAKPAVENRLYDDTGETTPTPPLRRRSASVLHNRGYEVPEQRPRADMLVRRRVSERTAYEKEEAFYSPFAGARDKPLESEESSDSEDQDTRTDNASLGLGASFMPTTPFGDGEDTQLQGRVVLTPRSGPPTAPKSKRGSSTAAIAAAAGAPLIAAALRPIPAGARDIDVPTSLAELFSQENVLQLHVPANQENNLAIAQEYQHPNLERLHVKLQQEYDPSQTTPTNKMERIRAALYNHCIQYPDSNAAQLGAQQVIADYRQALKTKTPPPSAQVLEEHLFGIYCLLLNPRIVEKAREHAIHALEALMRYQLALQNKKLRQESRRLKRDAKTGAQAQGITADTLAAWSPTTFSPAAAAAAAETGPEQQEKKPSQDKRVGG